MKAGGDVPGVRCVGVRLGGELAAAHIILDPEERGGYRKPQGVATQGYISKPSQREVK